MQQFRILSLSSFLALLLFVSCGSILQDSVSGGGTASDSFHGTWITNSASQVLYSRDSITKAMDICNACGVDNVFVVVWNQAVTMYPSTLMKNIFGVEIDSRLSGRDPLQELIEEAHKRNIKVHAWFEYGFATSYNQKGGIIIQAKPGWAARDASGNLVSKNGFEWMNAFLPEVQQFMIDLVSEVVKNYDVDGIQGDDRLPALPSTAGYDDYTVSLYRQQHAGNAPPQNYADTEWVAWRTNLLTDFMGRLYSTVKNLKPSVVVSSAPSVYPWGKTEYLQDWPTWLNKGYVDLVIPQVYRYDLANYQSTLSQQLSYLTTTTKKKFYPGLLLQNGTYNPSQTFLNQMVESNRGNGLAGECFWFFEGLRKFPAFFTKYKTGDL